LPGTNTLADYEKS